MTTDNGDRTLQTANIDLTPEWTLVASVVDDFFLITTREGAGVWEFALTDTETAPLVLGHLVGDIPSALTRDISGDGYVWARAVNVPAGQTIVLVVTK